MISQHAVNAIYVCINVASAVAAIFAAWQWKSSADAADADREADAKRHNWYAAMGACLAAGAQAAVAFRAVIDGLLNI